MISSIISRLVILVFGTLYPAYASYKAVRTKNVKEYVKWMMYWIVFALFTCAETFTDVFCSFWFPFYYEFKVILVLWLLSPATKGSSILYRKFVHPMLTKREQEIDDYIAKAKEQGYHTVLTLGSKGVNYATTVIMQTAIKGGGGLVNQLRRSYSLSDISADMAAIAEMNRSSGHTEDELDLGDTPMPIDPRLRRSRGYSPRRSASGSGRVEMYFPEVDVNVRQRGSRPRETGIPLSHIRSNEDVSSGYSSAELLYAGHPVAADAQEPLVRTSSVGSSRVTRTKTARGGAIPKRPTAAEDNVSWTESEESDSGTQEEFFYDVPQASPSEPVAILPSATLSQPASPQSTVNDFKSQCITTSSTSQEFQIAERSPMLTGEIPNVVSRNENVDISATSSINSYKPNQAANQEGNCVAIEQKSIVEPLQADQTNAAKNNAEEAKSCNVSGITESRDDLLNVGNANQFHDCKTSLFNEIASTEDDLKKGATNNRKSDTIIATVTEQSTVLEDPVLADQTNAKDVKCFNINEITTPIDDVLNAGNKIQFSEGKTSVFNEVATSEDDPKKDYNISMIIAIGTCKEFEKSQENHLTEKITQELVDDSEFFDTENDLPYDTATLTVNSNISASSFDFPPAPSACVDQIAAEDKRAENNKVKKPIDDMWKDGRAGRYHKHPAPCPPKSNTELLKPHNDETRFGVEETTIKSKVNVSSRKSPSPRRESPFPKSSEPSPSFAKKRVVGDQNERGSQASVEREQVMVPSVERYGEATISHSPVAAVVGKVDVEPSSSSSAKSDISASPNQTRKETIISRLLSKPKNQLASLFPFLSANDDLPPFSELVTTSLTSLDDDSRVRGRVRSHSTASTTLAISDNIMSMPPELPPRKKTPEGGRANRETVIGDVTHKKNYSANDNKYEDFKGDESHMKIREMSHSPPRRHGKSD